MGLKPVLFALSLPLVLTACSSSLKTDMVSTPRDATPDAAMVFDHFLSRTEIEQRLDNYFSPLAGTSDFSGTIRIEQNGLLITQKSYGFADWENKKPHTNKTLFSAASVTKSVLAATLVKLEQKGLLSLQDPISNHLPLFGDNPAITIETVLLHRAGLPRDLPVNVNLLEYPGGVAGWLKDNPALVEQPGKRNYSNSGYALLAQLIEAATGQDFATAAKDHVLTPAGMNDSFVSYDTAEKFKNGANGYATGGGPSGVMKPLPSGLEIGSSGLITSAADLSKWARAITGQDYTRLLSGEETLGSVGRGEKDGRQYISLQGSLPGYAAGAVYWPEQDISITYVSNIFSYPALNMQSTIRDIMLADAPPLPSIRPQDIDLSPIHKTLAGTYTHPDFGRISIIINKDETGATLRMLDRAAYWSFYLTPIADGTLHWRSFDMLFFQDSSGMVKVKNRNASTQDEAAILHRIDES